MKYLYIILFSVSFSFAQNRLPASGNIGVGTLSPLYLLDVNGTINTNQLILNGTEILPEPWLINSGELYYNGGNIGIGTNDPNYLFDINGELNATKIFIDNTEIFPSPWSRNLDNINYSLGSVGIGVSDVPVDFILAVGGDIITEGVTVRLETAWPDYVFKETYKLGTLKETEKFIVDNGHLQGIPSASDIKAKGQNLSEIQVVLLEKIEELTLHTINQQKLIDEVIKSNKLLKSQLEKLTSEIKK